MYSSRKIDFTIIDNEPATPETPRFQRNVKISLLEKEYAIPIVSNTIENTEPLIASTPINDESYRGEMNETHGPREAFSWNGFITFWILVILFGFAVAFDWEENRTRRLFFTVLRGQAETYAYGLPEEIRNSWTEL